MMMINCYYIIHKNLKLLFKSIKLLNKLDQSFSELKFQQRIISKNPLETHNKSLINTKLTPKQIQQKDFFRIIANLKKSANKLFSLPIAEQIP